MSDAQKSRHLAAARRLLDELDADGAGADPQTKATAAVAHAVLVLAEQVAVARVVMATDAVDSAQLQASAQ
jgi:hypothetical protein